MINPFKMHSNQQDEDKQFPIVLLHTKEIYLTKDKIPNIIKQLNSWLAPLLEGEQTEEAQNEIKAINLRISSYQKLLSTL